jgi:hypothetical protein
MDWYDGSWMRTGSDLGFDMEEEGKNYDEK